MEILKVKRVQNHILQTLKEMNCQPRLLYQAKLSFKIGGEIKTLYDK
jgi:hypothetical protein